MTRDLEFDIRGRDKSGAAFDSATGRARAFDAALAATANTYAILETAAKGFVAGLAIGVVENFASTVRQALKDAADLVDMADKVGVATEDLQRMSYGFELAGVPASDIEQILTQWSKRIGDAYTQGGLLADIFKANHRTLTDSEGRLKSSVDLMREYADLVANAGSDQERMTLATAAFGKAGAGMVLALKDGADGMDELMRAADEAGGVMEDELLRSAADIDDEFNKLWRQFEIYGKTAVLNVSTSLSGLRGWFTDMASSFEERKKASELGTAIGTLGTYKWDNKGDRVTGQYADQRVLGAFGDDANADMNSDLAKALADNRARYRRDYLGRNDQTTKIPGNGDGGEREVKSRRAATTAMREQESAYERIMDRLQEEQKMLGLSETAQRIMVEQRRAGVEATSEQGRAIAALVEKIDEESRALEAAQDAADFMTDNLRQSFSDLLPQIDTGNRALDGFINRLIEASAEALFFGSGPLGGLFGGGLFGGFSLGGSATKLPSFEGGGDTGSGSRSGGVDGRGGFYAILHPNETVEDHTRGGGGAAGTPGVLGINVTVNGAVGNAELREMVAAGIEEGIETFSRFGLPYRLQQIQHNPSLIG